MEERFWEQQDEPKKFIKALKKIEVKDPRYDSELVAKLVSTVMGDGKKSLAERIVYTAIDKSNEGSDTVDPLESLTRVNYHRYAL